MLLCIYRGKCLRRRKSEKKEEEEERDWITREIALGQTLEKKGQKKKEEGTGLITPCILTQKKKRGTLSHSVQKKREKISR